MTGRLLAVAAVLAAASCASAGAAPPQEGPTSPTRPAVEYVAPVTTCVVLGIENMSACEAKCIADEVDQLAFLSDGTWLVLPCRVVRAARGTEATLSLEDSPWP